MLVKQLSLISDFQLCGGILIVNKNFFFLMLFCFMYPYNCLGLSSRSLFIPS